MLSDPREEDTTRLARQWLVAVDLVRRHCDAEVDQSLADLDNIQVLLDLNVLDPTDTYELQCLGVALGRVLARNVPGLDWAVIEDEYGRDPTIRDGRAHWSPFGLPRAPAAAQLYRWAYR